MSQEKKKKALLNEQTTKRFWKLAGLQPIHEKAYVFEEEDIDENIDENDDLDEGMRGKKEDEEGRGRKKMEEVDDLEEVEDLEERGMMMADEDEEPEMDAAPEEDQEVEVDVPEGDVDSLRTARDILDQILSAVEGGGGDEDPEIDMEEEPPADDVEDLEETDTLGLDETGLEEIAERIATRITKRITEANKK